MTDQLGIREVNSVGEQHRAPFLQPTLLDPEDVLDESIEHVVRDHDHRTLSICPLHIRDLEPHLGVGLCVEPGHVQHTGRHQRPQRRMLTPVLEVLLGEVGHDPRRRGALSRPLLAKHLQRPQAVEAKLPAPCPQLNDPDRAADIEKEPEDDLGIHLCDGSIGRHK